MNNNFGNREVNHLRIFVSNGRGGYEPMNVLLNFQISQVFDLSRANFPAIAGARLTLVVHTASQPRKFIIT